MRICIPLKSNEGTKASINAHFGSAPYFLIYNIDNGAVKVIENSNRHHDHGICHPLKILENQKIDIVVCKGMGARAVQVLTRGGIRAYKTREGKAGEAIVEYKDGQLEVLKAQNACISHNYHTPPATD